MWTSFCQNNENTSSLIFRGAFRFYFLRPSLMLHRLALNLLCTQGCPWTNPSAYVSWVLGLQECTAKHGYFKGRVCFQLLVCMFMCVCGHVCLWKQVTGGQKEVLDPLEMKLQVVVKHCTRILGAKCRSSAKASCILNCWVLSPAPNAQNVNIIGFVKTTRSNWQKWVLLFSNLALNRHMLIYRMN